MVVPKYSDWKKNVPDKIEIDAQNFDFLFEANGKPKKKIHNFLRAYALSVYKITIEQKLDRFPNLKEIQNIGKEFVRDENQGEDVVYSLSHRLTKYTHFFNKSPAKSAKEGVYLTPAARRIIDKSGKYSDLIFDFEKESLTLPEPNPSSVEKKPAYTKLILFLSLIVIIFIIAFLLFGASDKPALKGKNVIYNISGSIDEGGSFFIFELANPDGAGINSTIVLPTGVVIKPPIVEKGPVSISQSNDTTIGLNTNKDARVKIYVPAIESVPLVITYNYKGNPAATVTGKNNHTQSRTAEKFQWNFEFKISDSILIRIEQEPE